MNGATYESEIGWLGIAWTAKGVSRSYLPGASRESVEQRLVEAGAGLVEADAAPAPVRRAMNGVAGLLAGKRPRLGGVRLDFDGVPPFHQRIYEATRTIAIGSTITYGELAALAGSAGAARVVGTAMARNPFAPIVPCHRVLASTGRPGGFSAPGGLRTKARLLGIEGVALELKWNRAAALRELAAADPEMGRLIAEVGPFRLRVSDEGGAYESILKAIVFQQLAGAAARAIFTRLKGLFDATRHPTPQEILAASDERLRSAGLSRPKIAAIRDLAGKTLDGTVPAYPVLVGMDDDEIIERLTSVRGVGRWTVEMFLIFRLGRPDVLPVDDLAVRKGYAGWFGGDMPQPRDLAAIGEQWSPYRSVASWYLWRASERFPLTAAASGAKAARR